MFGGDEQLPERPQSVVDFRERRDLDLEVDTGRGHSGRPTGRSIDDLHADRYSSFRRGQEDARDRDKPLSSTGPRPLSSAVGSDIRFRETDRLSQPLDVYVAASVGLFRRELHSFIHSYIYYNGKNACVGKNDDYNDVNTFCFLFFFRPQSKTVRNPRKRPP